MIQSYTQNGDFDELLKTLSSLFPPTGQLQHLFVGKFVFLQIDKMKRRDDKKSKHHNL